MVASQTPKAATGPELADRLITFAELQSLTGIPYSRSTLWRLERAGKFPARIKLSPRRSAWPLSELIAWINSRPRGMAMCPNAVSGAGRKPRAAIPDSARA